jgi:hypothetical protein
LIQKTKGRRTRLNRPELLLSFSQEDFSYLTISPVICTVLFYG